MKTMVFLAAALMISFIAVELILRLSVLALPSNPLSPPTGISIPDPVLGHRFKPGAGGHDMNGFRNDSAYSRADIVVLGDSQTYGSGVEQRENWPSRLQEQTGLGIYNMSAGGWGPVESMFLLEEGLRLRPRLVIEAIYAGNDFFDCFTAAYYRLNLDSLKTSDPLLATAVDSAESVEKYSSRVGRAYSIRNIEKREGKVYRLKNWLYGNLYSYKLLSLTKSKLLASLSSESKPISAEDRNAPPVPLNKLTAKRWADSRAAARLYPSHYLVFDAGASRTILTPGYRGVATDMDDPRVREGVQLACAAIDRMASRLRKMEVDFLVLLIPTKELVFAHLVDNSNTENDEARDDYFRMLANERLIWSTVKARLDSAGIAWLDGLPCLREAFNNGAQPYMVTENGHPDAPGHRALAECVSGWLHSSGLKTLDR